jgi:sec-independent protein translocase protein TatB
MLRSMFGMGGTEILVILIVALLFLGPDKLPDAAKKISKGIRDLKKQSRVLQQTIEDDENIGGAIRDLKSALRGEDEPIRPRPIKPKQIEAVVATAATAALPNPDEHAATDQAAASTEGDPHAVAADPADPAAPVLSSTALDAPLVSGGEPTLRGVVAPTAADDKPRLTMPATAGEADDDGPASKAGPAGKADEDAELAALVKPAPNTIARSAAPSAPPAASTGAPSAGTLPAATVTGTTPAVSPAAEPSDTSERKHG